MSLLPGSDAYRQMPNLGQSRTIAATHRERSRKPPAVQPLRRSPHPLLSCWHGKVSGSRQCRSVSRPMDHPAGRTVRLVTAASRVPPPRRAAAQRDGEAEAAVADQPAGHRTAAGPRASARTRGCGDAILRTPDALPPRKCEPRHRYGPPPSARCRSWRRKSMASRSGRSAGPRLAAPAATFDERARPEMA